LAVTRLLCSLSLICALLSACDISSTGTSSNATTPGEALPPVDEVGWRTVPAGDKHSFSIWEACAGAEDDLQRADPSLKGATKVALDTLDAQVARHGKLQAQCSWTGPNGRTGRIVVDVLCWNDNDDRCARFAYATEGTRRIQPVAAPAEQPPPPVSSAFPPGRDQVERDRSKAILAWTRDNAPEELGVLRTDIQSAKVGTASQAMLTPASDGQLGHFQGTPKLELLGRSLEKPSRPSRFKDRHPFADSIP
jgi:hypothetical protein